MDKEFLAEARSQLDPILKWELSSWQGLPEFYVEILNKVLGLPSKEETSELGYYPAQRFEYHVDGVPSGGLVAYARNNRLDLVETLIAPPLSIMDDLEEPTAILHPEISIQGAFVPEYLYCKRGLVLSVARPFDEKQPLRILRCRGIRPIETPDQFGAELYRSNLNKTFWLK